MKIAIFLSKIAFLFLILPFLAKAQCSPGSQNPSVQFGTISSVPLTTNACWYNTTCFNPCYLVSQGSQPYPTFSVNWPTSGIEVYNNNAIPVSFDPSSAGTYSGSVHATYYSSTAGTNTTVTVTASGTYSPPAVTGFVNPKYVVVGVTYAPPGPTSTVTYSGSTLVGNTTTTNSSFQNDVNVTITVTKDISAWSAVGGAAVKIANTISTDSTQGSNSSSTVTVSKTTAVTYQTKGTGNACAPVNHDYDTIWLWLNPLLIYSLNPSVPNSLTWNGYGYDNHDPSGVGGRDIFPVQVGWLNGHFGDDPSIDKILARGWVTQNEKLTWPAGEGPGLTSTDKANILAADPFTNPSYTLPSPPPLTSADDRFTLDPYPPNPVAYVPGGLTTGYSTVNVNTQSASNGTSYSYKQAFGTDVSFSGGTWLTHLTVDIKTTDTLTWNYSWLDTLTTTQTYTNALSVTEPSSCTPPYAGPGQFIVYQDNKYGTFMFYPAN